uniref:Uncharacterized protein n=1 Tax=Oryza sativa subsp. japonica TaxID=39947 RepID=Q9AY97_ORYSJ|nr:hypothetical protein [Oryza sativa Japonica Group]
MARRRRRTTAGDDRWRGETVAAGAKAAAAAKDDGARAEGGGAHGREERKEERGFLTEAMTATGGRMTTATRAAGRSWVEMESSPACERSGASATIGDNQMVAEVRAGSVSATAATARRGGGSSGGDARPEMGSGSGARVWRGESGTAVAHGK